MAHNRTQKQNFMKVPKVSRKTCPVVYKQDQIQKQWEIKSTQIQTQEYNFTLEGELCLHRQNGEDGGETMVIV